MHLGAEPTLTIALPTFNRSSDLRRTVGAIASELDERVAVLVCDNHSQEPAERVLQPILERFATRIRVVRHEFNIGGNANILRCIELTHSPYVWILSDDDLPVPGCVETILRRIEDAPATAFWKFSSTLHDFKKCSVVDDPDSYLSLVGSLGHALWISDVVFNREQIVGYMALANHWASSCAPHLILALLALRDKRQAACVGDRVVEFKAPSPEQLSDRATVFAGLPLLLQLPLNWSTKKTIGRMIADMYQSPESLALWISQTAEDVWCAEERAYWFRSLCGAILETFSGPMANIRCAIGRRSLGALRLAAKVDAGLTGGKYLTRRGLASGDDSRL